MIQKHFCWIFSQLSCKTGFVTVNFMKANIGRLEPLILAMFCVYQNLQAVPAPRKRVWARVQGGLRSFRGRSHSVVHYSGTKCHEVIYTLYNLDNPVTLRTGVHKRSLQGPWATAPCEFSFRVGHNKACQRFWYSKSCKFRGSCAPFCCK